MYQAESITTSIFTPKAQEPMKMNYIHSFIPTIACDIKSMTIWLKQKKHFIWFDCPEKLKKKKKVKKNVTIVVINIQIPGKSLQYYRNPKKQKETNQSWFLRVSNISEQVSVGGGFLLKELTEKKLAQVMRRRRIRASRHRLRPQLT